MSGSQCCENPPTLRSSSGGGCVQEFGGHKTYISGSSDSKRVIILNISDVFGYEAPTLRKLADRVAAAGFYVVVPDFLHGDPFAYDTSEPLPVWIKSHEPDKAAEDAKQFIEALRYKGISAIGAAGFCWGAKVIGHLAKSDDLKAVVMFHPSFVTVDDINEVKVPIAVLGAEVDKYSPIELLKQFEEVISFKSEVDGYVKIFPGVVHGWAVRYNEEDEAAAKSADEAHQNMLDWFTKYVKSMEMLTTRMVTLTGSDGAARLRTVVFG